MESGSVPGFGRASPPRGAGGRVRTSGLTLLELAAVVGLFAVVVGMAFGFSQSWRQAWHAERLAVRLSIASDQAQEALSRWYVGEYCSRRDEDTWKRSFYREFTAAQFYSDVLEPHVDEVAWARLLRDLPGGDAPRDFFTGWAWRINRGPPRFGFAVLAPPPVIEVRWGGYDPDEFGVPGAAMAERAGAAWDDGTNEMIWQRNLNGRIDRRQTQLRRFLKENSSAYHAFELEGSGDFPEERCF